jgi:hypothetical protein
MSSVTMESIVRNEIFWNGSFSLVSEKEGEIVLEDNVSAERHALKTWDEVHSFLYDQKWENNRF